MGKSGTHVSGNKQKQSTAGMDKQQRFLAETHGTASKSKTGSKHSGKKSY